MKRFSAALAVCCMVGLLTGAASATEKDIVDVVAEGCKKEIVTYCKDVKQGEGRVLACLYSREDKISGRCEYALYDAASQLQRLITDITYVASECRDDLKNYCSSVKRGEGRLLDCIDLNKEKLSSRCNQAFKDVRRNK